MAHEDSKNDALLIKNYSAEGADNINSLDSTIETLVGDLGWSQLFQSTLASAAWFFDAQQTFVTVFSDAAPTWHLLSNPSSQSTPDLCGLASGAWEWDAPRQSSTVSDFGLECANPILAGMPASAFFAGCLIGGIMLATLADSFLGRKKMLSFSCLAMGLSALLTAALPSGVWSYSLLRLAAGLARSTIGTSALVLSTELVGKRWRGAMGVAGFVFSTLGFLSLPGIAYLTSSSWRSLYVWTAVPTIVYAVLVYFFVVESPRWLFVQGRSDEAVAAIRKITTNSEAVDYLDSSRIICSYDKISSVDLYSAIRILVGKRWALRRLVALSCVGFGVGFIYYAMPLALDSLDSNLYVSVALNALSEIPASLIILALIDKVDRKTSLLFFTSLSGISSVALSVLKQQNVFTTAQLGLELVSFFGACSAFGLMLIFTTELFPTSIRNSAVSLVRQSLVLGGVFGPPIVAAGEGFVAFAVFGVVIGCCGLFVVSLPETRGGGICDTAEEEERKDKSFVGNHIKCSGGSADTDVV